MVQLDGSTHDWFEGRAPKCTLLVFIDDATSKLLWLEFVKSESHIGVMKATRNYMTTHGIPCSFYVDFGSVFSVNLNNPERDKKTQWERVVAELSVEVLHAHSPQAKGRVERSNRTLQDRLIKEMRLAGVSSAEAANQFVRESDFISKHNQRFAIRPAQDGDAHKPTELHNLDDVFCLKEERILANDYTISHNKRILQLGAQQPTIIRPKNTITVKTYLDGSTRLLVRNAELVFSEINARKSKPIQPKTNTHVVHENSRRWVSGLTPLSMQNTYPIRRVG
jgi:hypothetical protein